MGRKTQSVQERLSHGTTTGNVRSTQSPIEFGRPNPVAAEVLDTQGAIEWSIAPPNSIFDCQACIEVAWPMGATEPPPPPPPPVRSNPDAMLVLDLGGAVQVIPDYDPQRIPDYN